MKFKLILASMTLLLTLGLSSAAHADTISFTLTNSTLSVGTAGGTLTYYATVSAPGTNGAPVYLNSDSFNVSSPLTLDDTDFFNFPPDLAAGATYTGALFTITVPAGTAANTYSGFFSLLGGADSNASDTLGSVTFSTDVTSSVTPTTTPEPGSLVLLGTGMIGLVGATRRRLTR